MDCIFCKIANGELDSKTIYEDDMVKVIMDISPVVDGHTLIIPKKHYTDYMELDSEISAHLFEVAKIIGKKLMEGLGAKSVTLLMNYGDDQAVKHVHLHLLPDFGTVSTSRATRSIKENYKLITETK
ncbi:MAG: HIT domain-containing protein [Bacilli bacterium]|nr:HIT domain-containing protein [Bacilli bacterium]